MKASVVITTKDRLDFLHRAVESILRNDFLFIDIVIVNDGGAVISDIDLPSYTNLKVLNNKISLGGNKARNQGVLAAEGDFIFFLDDDDAYTAEAISEKLRIFEADDDVVLVYTGVQFVMSNKLEMVIRKKNPIPDFHLSFQRLLADGNLIGPTSCVAVRKSSFIAAGMFDEKLGAMQDYELWLRMIQYGLVRSDRGCNLIYTIHSSGAQMSSKHEKYLSAADFIARKYQNEMSEFGVARAFWAEAYFRIALSCAHTSEMLKVRFAMKSFFCQPRLKSLVLFIPSRILKTVRPFV